MLKYSETPIVEIFDDDFAYMQVKVFVKREDLNHSLVTGNKWWKLKYNLEAAKESGAKKILTFGGAFSNHIYATSAASRECGFESIGIIRGEESIPLNQTLKFATDCGMSLKFISRTDYRWKTSGDFLLQLRKQFGNFFLIPEGGTNNLAVKGCAEFANEKLLNLDFDYLCLPVGTGGTMAGLIAGLEGKKKVIGFSVLKNSEFLKADIENLTRNFSGKDYSNWRLETNYHFGGYAKKTAALDQFIAQMQTKNIALEFVYTGKMFAGVFDLISKGHFEKGAKILLLHTGGLRH